VKGGAAVTALVSPTAAAAMDSEPMPRIMVTAPAGSGLSLCAPWRSTTYSLGLRPVPTPKGGEGIHQRGQGGASRSAGWLHFAKPELEAAAANMQRRLGIGEASRKQRKDHWRQQHCMWKMPVGGTLRQR
jgi:hypothetical protein